MKKIVKKFLLLLILFISFFSLLKIFTLKVLAANMGNILPACTENGNCGLCDFLVAFGNISNYMISGIGALGLLMFVYGGLVWIMSGGNDERIKRGRAIIGNTIYGILAVFLAWTLVNFVIGGLVGQSVSPSLFGTSQPWYKFCTQATTTSTACTNQSQTGFTLACIAQTACTGNKIIENNFTCSDNLVCCKTPN
jgi:hypothetical protein